MTEVAGDYAAARTRGVESKALLFETFGGFGPEVCALLKEASEARKNKLTAREYDEATWATRSFGVFAEQQIAVALQVGVATEIAQACGGGVSTWAVSARELCAGESST